MVRIWQIYSLNASKDDVIIFRLCYFYISIFQYSCCDIFIYTLEGNGQILFKALTQTKKIDWTKRMIVYAVNGKHISTVFDVLDEIKPGKYTPIPGWFFVIDKEKALQFDTEYYLINI